MANQVFQDSNIFDRHGFDRYYGIPYSHGMCPCMKCFSTDIKNGNSSCWNKCRDQNVGCPLFSDEKVVEQPTDFTLLTEKYNNEALQFMQNSVQDSKPFFLYMGYHQTHHPQFASKVIPCPYAQTKLLFSRTNSKLSWRKKFLLWTK